MIVRGLAPEKSTFKYLPIEISFYFQFEMFYMNNSVHLTLFSRRDYETVYKCSCI